MVSLTFGSCVWKSWCINTCFSIVKLCLVQSGCYAVKSNQSEFMSLVTTQESRLIKFEKKKGKQEDKKGNLIRQ